MASANKQSRNHHTNHAFSDLHGRTREGMVMHDRRGMLKASVAGLAGLSLPGLLQARAEATAAGKPISNGKSVILLWMAGGPSHIDTWDPKPDRPFENRGPFGVTSTKIPGVQICEHLPRQAAMLDKVSIIRSVDCRGSSHQPNKVMQTGNRNAAPRSNPRGHLYPSFASMIAREKGANQSGMPAYVAFEKHPSHVGKAGYLGKQYDPFLANQACRLPVYSSVGVDSGTLSGANLFSMPSGLNLERVHNRRQLSRQFDKIRTGLDLNGSMEALDVYNQQAADMVLGRRAQEAFDINQEPQQVRERYGKHLWSQQVLLARRLVESGVSFVTLDLSYHTASGTWDNHGIPGGVYGGISKGLKPLLDLYDHFHTTLIEDLEERGMLDDVLVISMGEFGRTPNIGTQGSTDGRNHWPVVMSMCLAGGGMQHGQVIGSTEKDGSEIRTRPVTPGDIGATIYRHMGVPIDVTYQDDGGRPIPSIIDGNPISELF
jgi:hypothetical protein